MRGGVSDETRAFRSAFDAVQRILPDAAARAVLDLLLCAGDDADRRIPKGADTVSEVVLRLLYGVRHARVFSRGAARATGRLGNALRCAWLAIGNVWMFGGLLVTMKKAQRA